MSITNWHMNVIKRHGLNPLDIYANFWCRACGGDLNFVPYSFSLSYCGNCGQWNWEANAPHKKDVRFNHREYTR